MNENSGEGGRTEELKTQWENEAHHLSEQGHEEHAAVRWHVWVARYPGNRKDHLVFGDSDSLEEHAPAIAHGQTSEVEHLGTFADFAGKRATLSLDLPQHVTAPGELTAAIGRGQFWDVIWGRV